MPLCLARAVRRVESTAVVVHGNAKPAAAHFTGNAYFRRLSMAYGVRDEFADRVQNSVRRRIAYGGARPGEAHCNGCRACDGRESLAYRLGEVRFVQNVAAKVPQAPPEICAAGADHLRDGVKASGRGGILAAEGIAGGRDLISDRCEVLRSLIQK